MIDSPSSPFLFVIDTADYAGNFERELCAFITGRTGECGVGRDMSLRFTEETGQKPFENVIEEADDRGCRRPVTIYASPKPPHEANSVAISFDAKPTKTQIALMKARAATFAAMPDRWSPKTPRISSITGFRLIKQTITRKLEESAV